MLDGHAPLLLRRGVGQRCSAGGGHGLDQRVHPQDDRRADQEGPGTGKHAGKAMIPGPAESANDSFLTDQRTFSADPKASARVRCLMKVDMANGKWSAIPCAGATR